MRRRAREYDEYRTVLRGSGTRGGLRGSDPKKGIFEYDEYRTVLRRDGRLHDFEYDEYRTVLGERDQKASTSAFSRVQRYPVKRPYSIEYRCYSETAARLKPCADCGAPLVW
jgi:hypothetical protein